MMKKKIVFIIGAGFYLFSFVSIFNSYAENTRMLPAELAEKIAQQKLLQEHGKKQVFDEYFSRGLGFYKRGRYAQALEEFKSAQGVYLGNKEAAKYILDCQENIEKEAYTHYLKGIKYYGQNKYIKASDEFLLIPEVSVKFNESQDYLAKIENKLKKPLLKKGDLEQESDLKDVRKEVEQQLKELKEQQMISELRKKTQEEKMMLDVEKAYLPGPKVERLREEEKETPEEKKEKEEAEARAQLINQLNSITVPALSLTDADIRDVIRQLMNMTGVTIVLDEAAINKVNPGGMIRVTFTTVNPMPLLELLELSLKTTGLRYRVEPAYIWISDKESLAKEELLTKTYKLKYGVRKIREVSLTEFGSGGEGAEKY